MQLGGHRCMRALSPAPPQHGMHAAPAATQQATYRSAPAGLKPTLNPALYSHSCMAATSSFRLAKLRKAGQGVLAGMPGSQAVCIMAVWLSRWPPHLTSTKSSRSRLMADLLRRPVSTHSMQGWPELASIVGAAEAARQGQCCLLHSRSPQTHLPASTGRHASRQGERQHQGATAGSRVHCRH